MTLIGQKSSLNKFSRYIKWYKRSWKKVKPSTRRDMTSIVLITVSKLEMKFGFTLVRRGLKEKVKKCADCIVRTDADVVGPYNTWQMLSWQGRATHGKCWLAIVWTNHFLTCVILMENGLVTRGPSKGRHVSPGQWSKNFVVSRTRPRDLRARGRALGRAAQPVLPPMVLNI
jgi:hypothetical protein